MESKVDVLLGLQWGDEGKGKIIDVLTPNYDIIARFQGGPNAGHTLEFNGQKHVMHLIPSGIFHPKKLNLLGNGMVICPIAFEKEVKYVSTFNPDYQLFIADGAQLILPTHRLLDKAMEEGKGKGKIGSTLQGIGPCYGDKTNRCGLRVGDILKTNFLEKYEALKERHLKLIALEGYKMDDESLDKLSKEEDAFLLSVLFMNKMSIVNDAYWLDKQLRANKTVLAEGAQGTLLDIDHGNFPFVTSSSTTIGGVCIGLGIAANRIGKVYGLFKAYCTRVGSGPFPTELGGEFSAEWCATQKVADENMAYPNASIHETDPFVQGIALRKRGNEVGATTGRLRRCGWLDIPALKYACMINGVTDLIISKADVLSGFEVIDVCKTHVYENEYANEEVVLGHTSALNSIYTMFKGWDDLTSAKRVEDLPENFKKYLDFIENETKLPISIISLGPDRIQTLWK